MAKSNSAKAQRDEFLELIEDGELDDYLSDLQTAIDDRNSRRKDALLRQIRGVYGENAQIVVGGVPSAIAGSSVPQAPPSTGTPVADTSGIVPRAQYVPQTGPQIPAAAPDAAADDWPTPIASGSMGEYAAVPDPMAAGPGE